MEKVTVVMLGPSRVGKTSLVVSAIHGTNDLINDVAKCVAVGDSAPALRRQMNAIKGCIQAGDFEAAILGTGKQQVYEFEVSAGDNNGGFHFEVVDYPGDWIRQQSDKTDSDWGKHIKPKLKGSRFVIVPTDAALMMNAKRSVEKTKVREILEIEMVKEILEEWVRDVEDPTVVFAPVKCESYFNDNPPVVGKRDKSNDLEKVTREYYGEVLKSLLKIKESIKVEYHPIDTMGPVALRRIDWSNEAREHYYIDGKGVVPPEYSQRGGEHLLARILLDSTELAKKAKEQEVNGLARPPVTSFINWLFRTKQWKELQRKKLGLSALEIVFCRLGEHVSKSHHQGTARFRTWSATNEASVPNTIHDG